ncbi:hypothetical protein [Planomicrobium okeanokoites]|uniref:Uncharacterized protein n=1 Tax=Planomicrobium okeanokoites TaxID=244 RepID=A0ABV7KMK2_PLAOK|nr:hypothetical protein [Planomicrobium okeanokoites]TAA65736.1 hypothetical protein D2910_16245 [Planomicrobium okeanokoites]
MKNWKNLLSIILVVAMLFSVSTPAFANTKESNVFKGIENFSVEKEVKLKKAIQNTKFKNQSEQSAANQRLISKTTNNPEENLEYADVVEGQTVLVYKTSENKKVAVTDDFVEIVEQVDENTFLINGVEHNIEYTYEEEFSTGSDFTVNDSSKELVDEKDFYANDSSIGTLATTNYSGFSVIPNPGGTWNRVSSGYHNVYLENKIGSYTVAGLSAVIGFVIGGVLGNVYGAVAGFIAGIALGSQYTNSSTARAFIVHYERSSLPAFYKKTGTSAYAMWNGSPKYLGFKAHYYSKSIGGAY